MTDFPFSLIEQKIQYVFKDKNLLYKAFIHSSFAHQHGLESNERMELFGDAILEFLATEYLYEKYPNKDDGELSKARASIISAVTLKKALSKLDLSQHLLMSRGAVTIKNTSFKLDSNLYESLVCAIYLDGGIENAKKFVIFTLKEFFDDVDSLVQRDYISLVNEHCQINKVDMEFQLIKRAGPDHRPLFVYGLLIDGKQVSTGEGRNKRKAQWEAAKVAYNALLKNK